MILFSLRSSRHFGASGAALSALIAGGLLAAAPAAAQADFDNIMISGLRMLWIDQGKPNPRMSSERDTAYFYHRRADGKIVGAWLTTSCSERTGRGRLPFAYAGGADSGSDTCESSFRSNFRWTSTAQRRGNRLVLEGRGEMNETCARTSCGETRIVLVERATLRIEPGRCTVEAYYREHTRFRDGKAGVVQRYSPSANTRCALQ
jgi:hypothetical protein